MSYVLIIDDHPIILQGCRRMLEDAGVREIQEATGIASGYRLYRRQKPEVVIVDLTLKRGGLDGLDFIKRIRRDDSRTPILVFSMHSDPVIVSRVMKAGATGYVLKDAGPRDFLEAFKAVRANRRYLDHSTAVEVALIGSTDRNGNAMSETTPRELQTLALLAEGKPYLEIAEQLGVSYKTVVNTCSHLKTKLGARNLPELIRLAVQHFA
ncbi:MAG: response regulator transcription factor [Mesorhizobium sp.]